MGTLKATFLDVNKKNHVLYYYIIESDLANRWVKITKENQAREDKRLNYKFTNTVYKHIDKVRNRLTDCINKINKMYDEPLPIYEDVPELTTFHLNYLHEEFERYGDRMQELIDGKIHWSTNMHDNFLVLNELIHLHEDVLKSKTAEFPNMAVLYDYYPQELHYPILESDKLWLTNQLRWGELYLGYNTLGKDWLKVHIDNDIEVIERDQVRPQIRFAAEAWMNFGPDSSNYWSTLQFEKWVKGLPKEIQKRVPINDLNKLSLGRYKIGNLIVNDDFINKYGGTLMDYQLPNSKAKLDWNMNVLSTFEKLLLIEFL
jgi:hypothetical protein